MDGIGPGSVYSERFVESLRSRTGHPVRLYNRARGAATLPVLFADYERDNGYFGEGDNQILVVQVGIVDCAPRPVPPWLKQRIAQAPPRLRAAIVRRIHDNRARVLRAGLAWRDTSPEVFANVYRRWLEHASGRFARVLVINIAPTTERMEKHSPGLASSIVRYNELISNAVIAAGQKRVRLVDVYSSLMNHSGGLGEVVNETDGHHITERGHTLYHERLLDAVAEVT